MVKSVGMNRITGTGKSFDVSIVDDGYIRIYGGMMAFGRKCNNKRRDELSVSSEDVRMVLIEYDNRPNKTNGELIRQMSDEELAVTMICPNEMGMAALECDQVDNKNCSKCCLDWLKKEAE